ncbi:MAG: hypothetical protein OXF65_05235 [Acidimicrobiaceae bacterium]|nr:hypothetical protein [Acidimicrobiaceae bacterium]
MPRDYPTNTRTGAAVDLSAAHTIRNDVPQRSEKPERLMVGRGGFEPP